jgi:hypothetical protein
MDAAEQTKLVAELADELQRRGADVGGFLLIDVEHARRQLHDADDVLRRVKDAIVASHTRIARSEE